MQHVVPLVVQVGLLHALYGDRCEYSLVLDGLEQLEGLVDCVPASLALLDSDQLLQLCLVSNDLGGLVVGVVVLLLGLDESHQDLKTVVTEPAFSLPGHPGDHLSHDVSHLLHHDIRLSDLHENLSQVAHQLLLGVRVTLSRVLEEERHHFLEQHPLLLLETLLLLAFIAQQLDHQLTHRVVSHLRHQVVHTLLVTQNPLQQLLPLVFQQVAYDVAEVHAHHLVRLLLP